MKQMIQDTEASKEELLTVLTQMAECLLQQDARTLAENKFENSISQEVESILSTDKEEEDEGTCS